MTHAHTNASDADAADASQAHAALCAALIREHQDSILACWEERVKVLPCARKLERSHLLARIPQVLERIAERVEDRWRTASQPPSEPAEIHATERYEQDFDLASVVTEIGMLRSCILLEIDDVRQPVPVAALLLLNEAIDDMVKDAIQGYVAVRDHMLRARVEELLVLADNIPQFAWMADTEGNPYWYNQRWLDYSGTTPEEMFAGGWSRFVHPDHAQRVVDVRAEAIAAGRAVELTFPLRGRGGGYRWFLCREIPIYRERDKIVRWFGTGTDITEQRFLDEATKVLNSSLEYEVTLQQIARLAVPDLADWCVVDLAEGHELRRVAIASIDPEAIRLADELNRKYPPAWDEDIGVPRVIRMGEPVFFSAVTDEQLVAAARDAEHLRVLRELHVVSCIITPLMARGRPLGAVTLVTSEPNRSYSGNEYEVAKELARRAGAAIDNARLYKESQQALSERAQAVKSREEVLAIVSHDLRGPLGVIGMSTSMLEETNVDAESIKRLKIIHRSADRMEHMIDDLLDVATIEANGLTLHCAMEAADELVATAVEIHEPRAARAGIQITKDTDLDSVQLRCDRDRMERVFTNLIGNAIKYCRSGDVISVRGHLEDGQVVFSVADTGPGIPADQVPHLFKRYWTSERKGSTGTGLGLYICKGIVEAHGGRLWVESAVGRGTTFSFALPLAEQSPIQ